MGDDIIATIERPQDLPLLEDNRKAEPLSLSELNSLFPDVDEKRVVREFGRYVRAFPKDPEALLGMKTLLLDLKERGLGENIPWYLIYSIDLRLAVANKEDVKEIIEEKASYRDDLNSRTEQVDNLRLYGLDNVIKEADSRMKNDKIPEKMEVMVQDLEDKNIDKAKRTFAGLSGVEKIEAIRMIIDKFNKDSVGYLHDLLIGFSPEFQMKIVEAIRRIYNSDLASDLADSLIQSKE